MFLAALMSRHRLRRQLPHRYTLIPSGIDWRCPHREQSVLVWEGLTLTYGTPAFSALCPSTRSKAPHRCSDIFLEYLRERSSPTMLRSSTATRSKEVTTSWARRKSAARALSVSLRLTLATAARFLARDRDPRCARARRRWYRRTTWLSMVLAGTYRPSDSAIRVERPLSIPTGFRGADTTVVSASCPTTTCNSTRNGVRTTRSSTTLPPARAAASRPFESPRVSRRLD